MCGIVGVVADPTIIPNVVPMLIDGLKRLEYRGYDSAGFAFIECGTGRLVVLKDKGTIDGVVERFNVQGRCGVSGIAHTRWATHGAPSEVNAHPHRDCLGDIAVVHNGIIKNFAVLRDLLREKGHRFTSETDTEVVAHLVEEYVRQGMPVFEAFKKAIQVIEGAYAIALIHRSEPGRIYFARMVSPLIIGLGDGFNMVSSDIPSMLPYTRRIVVLHDGEYGYIEANRVYIESSKGPVDWRSRITHVTWSIDAAEKGGYPHFMLKEIMEQPRVLYETYTGLVSGAEAEAAAKLLASAGKVYVTGAGTSFHAGLVFSYYMATIAGAPVIPFIASEYKVYESLADEDSVVVAISQSGETIDTLQAVRAFKKRGAKVVAVSNVIASSIPRESDHTVYTRAGPEIGVAATKTFLTQVLALTLITLEHAAATGRLLASEKKSYIRQLSKAGDAAARGINLSVRSIERLSEYLRTRKNMYILGRGLGAFLAYEAALKVKEVSYIHAEAYPAGESKHGPIALVERGFPVLFIGANTAGDYVEKLQGNVMEMKARGAFTVLVGLSPYKQIEGVDYNIDVGEDDEILAPYAIIPPFQLLAYKLAVSLGYDPDKPRNLAKTVTVE